MILSSPAGDTQVCKRHACILLERQVAVIIQEEEIFKQYGNFESGHYRIVMQAMKI